MPGAKQYFEMMSGADGGLGIVWLAVGIVLCGVIVGYRNPTCRRVLSWSRWVWPPTWWWPSSLLIRPAWWWIIPTALVLRLPLLPGSFWYDETWSGVIARLPLSRLPALVMTDVHPPLPQLLFWIVGHTIGSSEIALRLPSLLFGLVSIYVMFRLARALVDESTGWAAALILTVLPAHIYYSTEARAYALLLLLVLVALLAIAENRPRLFLFAAAPLGWVHAYGYLYLVALLPVALLLRYGWRWVVLAAGAVSALWLPFLLLQSQDVADGFWVQPMTVPGVLWPITQMTVGGWMSVHVLFAVLIPVMVVTLVSVPLLWRANSRNALAWVPVALGVPVLAALLSFLWHPVYLPRALLPSAVLLVLPWAWLLVHHHHRRVFQVLLGPALLLALVTSLARDEWRVDVRSAFTGCAGADLVYTTSSAMGVMARYYFPGPVALWPGANDLNQSLSDEGKAAFGFQQLQPDELPSDVCVITQHNPLTRKDELLHLAALKLGTPDVPLDYQLYQVEVWR